MGAGASLGVVPEELLLEAGAASPQLVKTRQEQVKYSQEALQKVRRNSFNELRRKSKSFTKHNIVPDAIPVYEVPTDVKQLLAKIGIENNPLDQGNGVGSPQNRTTKLVSHIFECIQGLQHLVLADQSAISIAAQQLSSSAHLEMGLASIDEGLSSEAVKEQNCSLLGRLIHEMVTIYGLCGNTLKVVLENTPQSAAMEDIYGRLPLHVAVDTKHPWMGTIHTLLDAYPGALGKKDGAGRLPLHIAVDQTTPSIELIKLLVSRNGDAAKVTRGVGRLPIHYAVFPANMSIDIVDCLLNAYPLGAQCTDVYCKLPLHYAIDKTNGTNVEVVQRLLLAYPKGALVKDTHNQTPLQIAIQRSTHGNLSAVSVMQTLLAALQLIDIKNNLPQLVMKYDLLSSLMDVHNPCVSLIKYLCKVCRDCVLRSPTNPCTGIASSSNNGMGMIASHSSSRLSFGRIKTPLFYCRIIGNNGYDVHTVAYRFNFSEYDMNSPLSVALTKHDSVTCRVLLQVLSSASSELVVFNLIPLGDDFYASEEYCQPTGVALPSKSHSASSIAVVPLNTPEALCLTLNSHNYQTSNWLPHYLSVDMVLRELTWEDRKYGLLLAIGADIKSPHLSVCVHSPTRANNAKGKKNGRGSKFGVGMQRDDANSPSFARLQVNRSPNPNQQDQGVPRNTSQGIINNEEKRKVSDARLSLVDVEMLQNCNSKTMPLMNVDSNSDSGSDVESSYSSPGIRLTGLNTPKPRLKTRQTLDNNIFRRVYLADKGLLKAIVEFL